MPWHNCPSPDAHLRSQQEDTLWIILVNYFSININNKKVDLILVFESVYYAFCFISTVCRIPKSTNSYKWSTFMFTPNYIPHNTHATVSNDSQSLCLLQGIYSVITSRYQALLLCLIDCCCLVFVFLYFCTFPKPRNAVFWCVPVFDLNFAWRFGSVCLYLNCLICNCIL